MIEATLIRRYKRFLADVRLSDGSECTAHCPNPGAMTGLVEAGMRVYLLPAKNPQAKLPYRWVLVQTATSLVGIDTARANGIMAQALQDKAIPEFADYSSVKPEVKIAVDGIDMATRLDFCLGHADSTDPYYLEVKSATLCTEQGVASFPDSVTKRGQKHLQTLMTLREQGHRAALFFVVQRSDCTDFRLAADIDPIYASLCRKARAVGVEVQAWGCTIEPATNRLCLDSRLAWLDG